MFVDRILPYDDLKVKLQTYFDDILCLYENVIICNSCIILNKNITIKHVSCLCYLTRKYLPHNFFVQGTGQSLVGFINLFSQTLGWIW